MKNLKKFPCTSYRVYEISYKVLACKTNSKKYIKVQFELQFTGYLQVSLHLTLFNLNAVHNLWAC